MKGIIQIAGIRSIDEARMLADLGVRCLGFPLRLDVHAEEVSDDEAARIIASVRPHACGVLITYLDRAYDVLELCSKLGVRAVQLHGPISISEVKKIIAASPELFIIKSLIVKEGNLQELEQALAGYSSYVGAFITDTYDPKSGASGATGKMHDWSISRRLVDISPKPVILAGGLRPDNVRRAIVQVRPAGVDAHTGVEGPNGLKDPGMVRMFISEAKRGFEEIGGLNR
ncbi:MAG TPA: phosphoribosylanthranilate isomerase [Methanotrichaceae archaeon]|nr:phosphoribosylanthranilate isomerase [Methanotrichaceae archaeon]